jgi:16S rRNA G1207 methylase RsmC
MYVVYWNSCGESKTTSNTDAVSQSQGIKFIFASSKGVFSTVFVDLGKDFVVHDTNGEEPLSCMISAVSQVCTLILNFR